MRLFAPTWRSAANITGRVFTYYLALFTAGNGLPVFPSIYAVTRDAYRYKIDLRGMDPNGWLVYGNQVGFLDSDGTTPLYHDAVADATGSPGQLTGIQGGVSLGLPSFPLFFEPPAAATIAALGIPAAPIAPVMSSISFAGNLGGNTSLVNAGGTFKFTTNVPGVYDIVISRDGVDFDPTNPLNRSLRGRGRRRRCPHRGLGRPRQLQHRLSRRVLPGTRRACMAASTTSR